MVDVQVRADSKLGMRQLTLMANLQKAAIGRQVPTDDFYQKPDDAGFDAASLTGDFESLQELGLLWFERSAGGIGEVVLTHLGVDVVTEFTELRDSLPKRAMASRDCLLQWLYESDLAGTSSPVIDRFFETQWASFYGSPFTQAEIKRAGNWLFDEGLIAGTKSWGGPIPRPNITAKGIRSVEKGSSVNAPYSEGGTTVHNNIKIEGSHSLNVSAGSSYVNQSNAVNYEQIEQVAKFVGSARSLVPVADIPEDQQADILEAIGDLEAEITTSAPNPSRIKGLVGKVIDIAITGTATGVVDALVAMGTSTLTSLG